jgi:light-regulated signal transduction histidine kinase (bacteriophytochrome)
MIFQRLHTRKEYQGNGINYRTAKKIVAWRKDLGEIKTRRRQRFPFYHS